MEIKIKQVNRYTIEINGEVYNDFKKIDSWEGMIKFENYQGTIIVSKDNQFSSMLDKIFLNKDEESFTPIKMSPEFIQCQQKKK